MRKQGRGAKGRTAKPTPTRPLIPDPRERICDKMAICALRG